jgi:hypothetical protein
MRVVDLRMEGADLGFELFDPRFQLEHALDTDQVHPKVGELLDLPEQLDVGFAVPSTAAPGAGRLYQPLALVDTERLGVASGQLGGD